MTYKGWKPTNNDGAVEFSAKPRGWWREVEVFFMVLARLSVGLMVEESPSVQAEVGNDSGLAANGGGR